MTNGASRGEGAGGSESSNISTDAERKGKGRKRSLRDGRISFRLVPESKLLSDGARRGSNNGSAAHTRAKGG